MSLPTRRLRTAWASAPNAEQILHTLELSHPRFSKVHYLTSNNVAFKATLESGTVVEFLPLPFAVKLPASDAQGAQLLDITIANAGADMVSEIEASSTAPDSRIEVVYRVYLRSDTTAPQMEPLRLSLDKLTMTNEAISGTAGRSDMLNFQFPSIVYQAGGEGPYFFPGLDR